MWPTVLSGDVLLVDQGCRVSRGDLVVVRVGGDLIAHRCVARDGVMLRTANARGGLDPWVSEEAVYGRVVGLERRGQVFDVPASDLLARVLGAGRLRAVVKLVWGAT